MQYVQPIQTLFLLLQFNDFHLWYILVSSRFYRTAPAIKREFELDFKAIEGEEDMITGSIPKLKSVNISDVMEAANIPTNLRQAYDTNKQSTTVHSSVKDIAELLDLTIAKISSADIQVAMENLLQIEDVFKKKKMDEPILKRIDQV